MGLGISDRLRGGSAFAEFRTRLLSGFTAASPPVAIATTTVLLQASDDQVPIIEGICMCAGRVNGSAVVTVSAELQVHDMRASPPTLIDAVRLDCDVDGTGVIPPLAYSEGSLKLKSAPGARIQVVVGIDAYCNIHIDGSLEGEPIHFGVASKTRP